MKHVYEFLTRLKDNNNREWFNLHKQEYIEVQMIFNNFTEQLIARIESWDDDIKDSALSVKDCTYRIYRDTRFSKNKMPYKTHIGAYICRKGKKSPYAGYYFHVEPTEKPNDLENRFLGNTLLASGLYCPQPKVVQSLRDEISVNGDSFLDAISLAKGFELDTYNVLKKVPRGFEYAQERWHKLLKHKDFSIGTPLKLDILFAGNDVLLEYVSERFKTCMQFNRLLNLAVDYALEEM